MYPPTTERDDMSSLAAYAHPITFAHSPVAPATATVAHVPSSSRSISRYDPSLGEPYNMVASEQAIWRAVIVQTLMDASSNSKKKENLQWKEEALIWLRGNSRDFMEVCHYAGFEPEFVRDTAKRALQRDCLWRAAPGTGEKAAKNRARGVVLRTPTQSR